MTDYDEEQYYRNEVVPISELPRWLMGCLPASVDMGDCFDPNEEGGEDLRLLCRAYKRAQNDYAQWLEAPDNFYACWKMLSTHPVFWTRYSSELTYDWKTNQGLDNMWMAVSQQDGKIIFMLEHGAHVEPHYGNHYHDYRLDVYAPTYEEAIIAFAAKVDKFFFPDGSERPEVEYEKSAGELAVEEAVAVYDKWKKEHPDEEEN